MPRDPATRRYRLFAYGLFIGFAALYIALVIRGIVLSLRQQSALPALVDSGDCRRPPASCAAGLVRLRQALDDEATQLQRSGTQAERLWDDWEVGWHRELGTLRVECCLRGGQRTAEQVALSRAAADIEELGRLYTVHLVQYAREIGPEAERCQSDLAVISGAAPVPTNSPANR